METDKGEIQWSTPTEHRKSTSDETNEMAKEGATVTVDKKEKGTWSWDIPDQFVNSPDKLYAVSSRQVERIKKIIRSNSKFWQLTLKDMLRFSKENSYIVLMFKLESEPLAKRDLHVLCILIWFNAVLEYKFGGQCSWFTKISLAVPTATTKNN